ncbi:DUF2939 domain-containing protein [Sphingomonas sp.]|jgi:hypothetical protein|uniref:DUF2939 domain-containing protein n=1 Tax=Sphingomonas sp. TaxID=28214 RepID=UPI002ED9A9DF
MKRVLVALLLIAAVAAGGWYWASPWWALQSMKDAAEARDVTALSRHVDYPAVRASLKRQLRARMESGERDDGVLGALVAGGIAERLVDIAVTPEGMRVIFAAAPLAGEPEPGRVGLKASDMLVRRDSIDRFSMIRRDGKPGTLVFRLRGARWMLTEIELPPQGLQ